MSLSDESSVDFRNSLIRRRFEKIGFSLLVASGKGGVGKSLISATFAAILAKEGNRAGLLDLDLHGPSSAAIFGAEAEPREGGEGILPFEAFGVKVMSIEMFVGGRPVPVGGRGKREIIKELIALTDWGELNFLVVDLPPETSDVMIAAASCIIGEKGAILITTPSTLSIRVVKRAAKLLASMGVPIIGVVENMTSLKAGNLEVRPFGYKKPEQIAKELGVDHLGELPLDPVASAAADVGDVKRLLESEIAAAAERVLRRAGLLRNRGSL